VPVRSGKRGSEGDSGGSPNVTAPCPAHSVCAGGRQAPVPDKGFWVDRSRYAYAAELYVCTRSTCIGGQAINASCFAGDKAYPDYDDRKEGTAIPPGCADPPEGTSLLCSEGARGYLCGSCSQGYIYRSEQRECVVCEDAANVTLLVLSITAFVAIAGFVLLRTRNTPFVQDSSAYKLISNIERGSIKVVWVTAQIIVSISWNLDITFPSPFKEMLGLFSIFSLDFLALECVSDGVEQRYFTTVILWCVIPIIMLAMIGGVGVVRWMRVSRNSDEAEDVVKIVNQHVTLSLLLTYLVLPPVANKQLQALDCIPRHADDSRWLRVDTAINCDSAEYQNFLATVGCFIALYQLIPVLWLFLLYQKRHLLDPPTSNHDERLGLFVRDKNPELGFLRFLFIDYKCDRWWFEVAEMYRRIVMIGVLPLASPVNATRASLGCVLSIFSVAYYREERPYRVKFTNTIAHMAQFAILITFYAALSIDTGVMMDFGLEDLGMGLTLAFVNFSLFVLALYLGWSRYRKDQVKEALKRSKALRIEDASTFTEGKFTSTFAVVQASLPASHTLCFFYCPAAVADLSQESGIPAKDRWSGVPFTLRQPHHTTENDLRVFSPASERDSGKRRSTRGKSRGSTIFGGFASGGGGNRGGCVVDAEAVVALSLPRHVLEPLPGFESDTALCHLPAKLLRAMRPTSYVAVINAAPWLDGVVMLPPSAIVRSFFLQPRVALSNTALQELEGDESWVREGDELDLKEKVSIEQVHSVASFIESMKLVRRRCEDLGVQPLFHYTQPSVVPLILQGGLRMSTQGQGDGGLYLSTKSPVSYGLGKRSYEEAIIRDCFGIERLDEYKGQGKLDAVLVCGCEPSIFLPAPGGRGNAKMVPRQTFQNFSLPHADGTYFLRPDVVLAVFIVETNSSALPTVNLKSIAGAKYERHSDQEVAIFFEDVEGRMNQNGEVIAIAQEHALPINVIDVSDLNSKRQISESPESENRERGKRSVQGLTRSQRSSGVKIERPSVGVANPLVASEGRSSQILRFNPFLNAF